MNTTQQTIGTTTVKFAPLIVIKDVRESYEDYPTDEKPFRPSDYLSQVDLLLSEHEITNRLNQL